MSGISLNLLGSLQARWLGHGIGSLPPRSQPFAICLEILAEIMTTGSVWSIPRGLLAISKAPIEGDSFARANGIRIRGFEAVVCAGCVHDSGA
jgi:hypothetical protein